MFTADTGNKLLPLLLKSLALSLTARINRSVITALRARPAEFPGNSFYFPAIVYTLTATRAYYARARTARLIHLSKTHLYLFHLEQLFIRSLSVSAKLPLLFPGNFRETFIGQCSGRIQRDNTKRFASLPVQKSRRHFTVINILQAPLPKPYARHSRHSVRHAAINFNPDY